MKTKSHPGGEIVRRFALTVVLAGLAALALICCEYFDPMDPLARGPREPDANGPWERVIEPAQAEGGSNGDDHGMCVQQTSDQGFIVAGYSQWKVDDDFDLWLVKTDSRGNLEWDQTYGGGGDDRGCYVEQTSDGGYIVVGYREFDRGGGLKDSDLWLIKIKPDAQGEGVIDWERTYGASGTDEEGYCVRCTADGGYIITGYTTNVGTGGTDLWLIKTNAEGSEEWTRSYGGSFSYFGWCVSQTLPDLGYVAAGVFCTATAENAGVIKTDAAGNLDSAWNPNPNPREFGTEEEPDYAYCVRQTSDGGYILAGETRSFDAINMDALVIKLDALGSLDQDWTTNPLALHNPFDGGSGSLDRANCVEQTSDGGYVLAGTTHYFDQDAWLVKMDSHGSVEWEKYFGESRFEEAASVRQTSDGGYILAGSTNSYAGGFNLYLVYYKP